MPHKRAHTREKAQEALTKAMAFLTSQPGKTIYSEPMSVEGIRQAILTENLRHGKVEVAVVDHAQVALPSNDEKARMPRYLQVKDVAESLRQIARRLNVAIVLTAQLNPPPKGEKPSMEMVRESKDINNASEIVVVIEHKREQAGNDIIITESFLHVEKARVGFTGQVPVVYRGEVYRFEEEWNEP
jgi:replicative DNA helicase